MYNPVRCPDTYCEWIELYNPTNEPINLSGWKLCGKKLLPGYVNNTGKPNPPVLKNTTMILEPRQYAIITDGYNLRKTNTSGTKVYQYFNIPTDSLALHVNSSTLCKGTQGLKNSGETINLTNGSYTEIVSYNKSNGWQEEKDGYSLQRINSSWSISNNSANWIAFPPSPGKQNFYPATYFEIFSISFPERNFVNNTVKFNITILNRGIKNGTREIGFSIKANSTLYSEESLISMEAISSKTILFNWTPKLAGNYTICAKANNTLCEKFAVFQLQNASISLNITKGNKKIIFYTNLSNASCTIDYNVSVGDFLVACGRMEKEAFRNATLDIGFGKFGVCANARINNFNDIFSYDNSVCRNITITPENKRYRIRVWLDKEEYELNETIK